MDPSPPDSAWVASAVAEVLHARRARVPVSPVAPPALGPGAAAAGSVRHRVTWLVAPSAQALGLDGDDLDRLRNAVRRATRGGLANLADTARLGSALTAAGIRHLVVKGGALGALLTREPGTRGPGDVDLWVAPGDVPAAEAVLADAGWHRRGDVAGYPRPDGWRWRLLLWGGHQLPLEQVGRSDADLHWRLTEHPGELSFTFDEAYDRSVAVPIGAGRARTLAPLDALEHVAQHGRKEGWPVLRQLVDVVDLVDTCGEEASAGLARRAPNVRAALGTASFVAPWLAGLVDLDPATRRRCTDAWTGCLALDRGLHERRSLTGREALRARVRFEAWRFRSAPGWPTRLARGRRVAERAAVMSHRRVADAEHRSPQ